MKLAALISFLQKAQEVCTTDADVEMVVALGEVSTIEHVVVTTDVSGTGKTIVRLETEE